MDLRAWSTAGFGEPLPAELIEARRGVDARGRRAARRAVRRGEAAQAAPIARLAVVEARARQRAVGGAAVPLLGAGTVVVAVLGVLRAARGELDGAVWIALALYGAGATVSGLRAFDRAPRAELRNRERLRELGQPYDLDALAAAPRARPPLLAWATGLLASFVVYDLIFGAFDRLLHEQPLTLGSVVLNGLVFAATITVVGGLLRPAAARRRAGRSPFGTRTG